jgi:hypothetical protein
VRKCFQNLEKQLGFKKHEISDFFDRTSFFYRDPPPHRIDSNCIVPYLILAKSTRLPILLCKYFSLAGAPKRTVRYLWPPTIPHCRTPQFCRTRYLRVKLSILQWETLGIKSYGNVRLAKWEILVHMSISLFSKSYGRSLRKISEPGFPHNFAKNDRQDLKMGCTDSSRRQLQSVLKIGV